MHFFILHSKLIWPEKTWKGIALFIGVEAPVESGNTQDHIRVRWRVVLLSSSWSLLSCMQSAHWPVAKSALSSRITNAQEPALVLAQLLAMRLKMHKGVR